MKSWPVMPGVPAAGHVTSSGSWHPGDERHCRKCHPEKPPPMSEASITCPQCGRTSHHPEDVSTGYCGACHDWTGAIPGMDDQVVWIGDHAMHYDKQGHPISLGRWGWLNARERFAEYRRIAEDHVGLYWVSTVWLGLDHSFGFGPPLIFETMVFLAGVPEDMNMQRYATEDQARAGHEAIVAEIRVLDERAADQERINDQ